MNPPGEPSRCLRSLLCRMPPGGQALIASSASAGWEGIHAVILEGRTEDFVDLSATGPMVMLVRKGSAPLDWRRCDRYSRVDLRPGDVLVAPPVDNHRMRIREPIEVFCCWIDRDRLADLARSEWPSPGAGPTIVEGLTRKDEVLWDLGSRLADELLAPVPGSRASAAAIETLIAVHLLRHYSSLGRAGEDGEPMADPRLRPVIDYIRENLGADVSLETLAGVAGLSPNYFLGAFREATGRTPHRYVTDLRVARACELLRDPHRPIPEVSLAVGFSSQSHLTEVFRRTMNTTPAAYRREVLGLSREADEPPG